VPDVHIPEPICQPVFSLLTVRNEPCRIFALSGLEVYTFNREGVLEWTEYTAPGAKGFNTAITLDTQEFAYINTQASIGARIAFPIATLEVLNPWGGYKVSSDDDEYISLPPAISPEGVILLGLREIGAGYTTEDGLITSELGPLRLQAMTSDGSVTWSVTVDDNVCSYPVVDGDGNAYFIFNDGDLYVYDPHGNLKWSFNIDESREYCFWWDWKLAIGDGILLLSTENTLYAIGDADVTEGETDLVIETVVIEVEETPTGDIPSQTPAPIACPGVLPPRLWVGGYAYVNPEPPLPNLVRLGANRDHAAVGQIPPGGAMEVLDGPECGNVYTWWKVRATDTGIVGWTVEADGASYWLVPCETEIGCGE